MGGGSSKNKNRVMDSMPSSQQLLDWRAKLEMQKNDANGEAASLKRELDGLSGVQEALARAKAEAKALQAQLSETRRLAAEAEKAKADADSLATQAQQAEKDRLKIVDEIEAMPSREELVKKVQQANEAAESAQAKLDDARRLASEASDKNFAMVMRKAEAEEALARAERDKEEAERLLAVAEKAEKDRLRVMEEIEAMPSQEEIIKTMKEANEAAESAQAKLDDARRLAAEASDKNSAMVKRKAEAEEALAMAIQDRAEAESLLATSKAEADKAEKDRLRVMEEIEAMPSREEHVKKAGEAKGRLDEILELKSQADALVAGAAEASKREGEAMAELKRLVKKISKGVTGVKGALSDSAITLATGSGDNTLKLWDAESGQEKCTLKGHSNTVRSVAWSPDGGTIASGSADNTVKLWDAESGQEKCTLEGHSSNVRSVAWSPDGGTIASGSWDNTVKLWDAESWQQKRTLKGHSDYVLSVAWSPDGGTIASGSADNTVKLWDAESGQQKRTLEGHSSNVLSVAWSPDGGTIASGSADNTVKLWDAESGQEKRTLEGHSSNVLSVAWSPDGGTIASGSKDNTVKLWDAESGQEKRTLKGHSGEVLSVAWSPDGGTIASGSKDNTVKLWDAESGQEKRTLEGHSGEVWSVARPSQGFGCASPGSLSEDDLLPAPTGPSLPEGMSQVTMDACLWTAISTAQRRTAGDARLELVSFCLRNGANPFSPMASGAWPATRLKQGFTLLHCAAFAGDRDAIRVLIKDSGSVERGLALASAKFGAKDGTSRSNEGGKTAEEIADMMGHAEAAAEIRAMVQKLQSSVDMKLETLEKNKEAMLKEYEATVLGDAEAGRPDPGRNGATLLLSVDEHRLVALAMHEFAVELITDAADASEGGIVRRTESIARSGSAGGAVQGAAAERAYHLNLKYGVETKDMITGHFVDAAAGLPELIQVDDDELWADLTKGGIARIEEEVGNLGDEDAVLDLNYILKEKTSEKKYDNGIRDEGRQGMTLADFLSLPECLEAKLKEVEVVALRFYSSKSFSHVTAPIRDLARRDRGEMVPLPATTIHVVNGLRKLRRVGAKNSDAVIEKIFFRGMKNLKMTDEFARVGGTELAPMSTTSELAIAVRYGMSRNSLIFRIVTMNNLQRGSDISHISVFPTESEVLFAPLTFLQPTGRSQILELGGITVTVVEVTPTAAG